MKLEGSHREGTDVSQDIHLVSGWPAEVGEIAAVLTRGKCKRTRETAATTECILVGEVTGVVQARGTIRFGSSANLTQMILKHLEMAAMNRL